MKNLSVFLLIGLLSACSSDQQSNNSATTADQEKKKDTIQFYGDTIPFLNPSELHRLEIQSEAADITAFYDLLNSNPRSFTQVNTKLDKEDYLLVGIRHKGESSFKYHPGPKKPFKLKLSAFISCQEHKKTKEFNFNNCMKDPSFMREQLFLDILRELNVPAQQSAFVKINDDYQGLYLATEGVEQALVKRSFGTKKGTFIKGEPEAFLTTLNADSLYSKSYIFKKKRNYGITSLKELASAIKNDLENGTKTTSDHIHMKSLMKAFAANNILVNVDAYNMKYPHNYYLFRPSKGDLFYWIGYDFNYAFGAWTPDLSYEEMVRLPPNHFIKEHPLSELVCSKNSPYYDEYMTVYKEVVDFIFNTDFVEQKIQFYNELIAGAVREDEYKMYTTEEYYQNRNLHYGDLKDPGVFIPGLTPFLKDRGEYLNTVLNEKGN